MNRRISANSYVNIWIAIGLALVLDVNPPVCCRCKRRTCTQAFGRSGREFLREIHLVAEAHGNPVDFQSVSGKATRNRSAMVATACLSHGSEFNRRAWFTRTDRTP